MLVLRCQSLLLSYFALTGSKANISTIAPVLPVGIGSMNMLRFSYQPHTHQGVCGSGPAAQTGVGPWRTRSGQIVSKVCHLIRHNVQDDNERRSRLRIQNNHFAIYLTGTHAFTGVPPSGAHRTTSSHAFQFFV